MPRHAFRFPSEVVAAVKRHVRSAIERTEPARFHQEAAYTVALISHLEGNVYQGEYGSIEFRSTVFDDRGRGAAEHRLGADFAITAIISDGATTVRKVILVQAKLGELNTLGGAAGEFLRSQIAKMKHLVAAPKVMEIREVGRQRFPNMVSGNKLLENERYTPMALPEYFTARVTTTLDGCTDPDVVHEVQDSSLPRIDVYGKLQRED